MAAALLAVLAAAVTPSSSWASCNPGRADDDVWYPVGVQRIPGGTVGGAYSKIREYSPYVEVGEQATPVYVQIESTAGTATAAHIGPVKYQSGNRYVRLKWLNGSTWTTELQSPQPVGADTFYTVLWASGAPNRYTFQVNAVTVKTATSSGTPEQGTIIASIGTLGNQMPGGYNNKVLFDDSNIYYSGAWHSFDGSIFGGSSYFGVTKVSSTLYRIWDQYCVT